MANLIGEDIVLWRQRYDEALEMRGIPCSYQYPIDAGSNTQGEPLADGYSTPKDTHIFLDSNPKVKTFKRYGWVVENDDNLPFLIHCSFNLPHLQKDAIFRIAGQYTELPDRMFRVTAITYSLQAPDHMICQAVPAYEEQLAGRTRKEVANTFNRSNHFLNSSLDYRGNWYDPTVDNLPKKE